VTSYRVLERGYISDVEGCKVVWENIRNIPRVGVIKKLLFLASGLNIFR